jgi:hypothetical protein
MCTKSSSSQLLTLGAHADALSRHPVPPQPGQSSEGQVPLVIAAVEPPVSLAQSGECDSDQISLGWRQLEGPLLRDLISYLENGELPSDDKRAKEILLGQTAYTMLDGVLYWIADDKSLRIIPPTADRHKLFLEAHEGVFSSYLHQAKIHGQLSKHYWWPGMRKDLDRWFRACTRCATRNVGKPVRPGLTPIPVCSPFNMVGVDILQLPKTK